MKNLLIFIFLFSAGSMITAQENVALKDGYQVFKYPNGAVSSEGMVRNGKPDGFWKSYYVTGIKKSEGKRTNFLLDSIWVFYSETGDTTEKINYLYGKKNGWYYKYKTDPQRGIYVYSKELFSADRKEGTAYVYYPEGIVLQTFTYSNGKKEGLSKEYSKEGNIVTIYEYHNDFLVSRERLNRTDNKGMKQGEWKEFYPNGSLKSERMYKDDQLNGYIREYDTRGKLVLTMLYENGAIVKSNVEDEPDIEIVTKHDENGKITYSGPYRNNIPVGVHREFGSDGKVKNAFIYNDNGQMLSEGIVDEAGKYNGKWKDLYANGKIRAEGQYADSRRTGQWKFYSDSGKVVQTGSFNNGRPDGTWDWFFENGELLREEEYFQGQRDGTSVEYSSSGEIIAKGQYTEGEKNGEWYYKSGNVTENGKYITGLRDGVWKSFYDNGKLKFKGNYVQGNADGDQTFYFENGRMKEEQYFMNGIRQKTWKKYNEDGIAFLVISYRDDVEVSINGVKIKLPEGDTKLIK